MTLQYPQLTYPGDVTGSPQAAPGHLLGCDEVAVIYEVIDAELIEDTFTSSRCYLDHPALPFPHTHVNLQYATAESLQRAAAGREA